MNNRNVLGIDIGGSHITAMQVDLAGGNIVKNSEVREPVNAKGSVSEIISLWTEVINKAIEKQKINPIRIGIAMPGPFDYNKGIAWMKDQDKYDSLYGLNVKDLLAKELNIPSSNIRFINDAESFLKGEVFSGAAKGAFRAIGLTLGTGLGSARYNKGNVEDADLWNSPFFSGIAEDYLSTRWFVAHYHSLTGITVKGVKELTHMAHKDDNALQTFRQFGFNLASFLKGVIEKDEPEVIVIGGNITNAFPLFSHALFTELDGLINKSSIKRAILGEAAALIGAASCWAGVEEEYAFESIIV